jgi:multisubunit Na+/H+ antiporter MnhF subunit
VVLRSRPIDGIVALGLCGTNITLVLLCLAAGFHQSVYFNVPVVAALCVWVGGMVYVRFVGRSR